MNRSIVLDKHEMVIDRDDFDSMAARIVKYERALKFIAAWELPEVEIDTEKGKTKIPYASAYGSQGAKAYMRNEAKLVLENTSPWDKK